MLNAKPCVGYKVVLINEAPTGHVLTRDLGSFRGLWFWGFFLHVNFKALSWFQ